MEEAGGHRVQRIPDNEKRGRVHTSTVTVAVVDSSHATQELELDPADLRIEWFSGTGKGGQHRNKHQNSARVFHLPTGIKREAQCRKRETSLREAMDALREELERRAREESGQRINEVRSAQVGSGMRGDKRRTYRFQDDRVVDHLTDKSAKCSKVMRGNFKLLW